MKNTHELYAGRISSVKKSKILYKISFWYGIVLLALSLVSLVSLYWVYQDMGVRLDEIIYVFSTNTFSMNVLWFAKLTYQIFFYGLVVGVSLSIIRNKTKVNMMTDIAAVIISINAFLAALFIIIGIFLAIVTHSVVGSFTIVYGIKGFIYPISVLASLAGGILFGISYVNENNRTTPRNYFKIILPIMALFVVVLAVVSSILHII